MKYQKCYTYIIFQVYYLYQEYLNIKSYSPNVISLFTYFSLWFLLMFRGWNWSTLRIMNRVKYWRVVYGSQAASSIPLFKSQIRSIYFAWTAGSIFVSLLVLKSVGAILCFLTVDSLWQWLLHIIMAFLPDNMLPIRWYVFLFKSYIQ